MGCQETDVSHQEGELHHQSVHTHKPMDTPGRWASPPSHQEQVNPGYSQYRRSVQTKHISTQGMSQVKLEVDPKRANQGTRYGVKLTNSIVTKTLYLYVLKLKCTDVKQVSATIRKIELKLTTLVLIFVPG